MDGKPRGGQKKKLEDAARYWACGSTSYQDAIDDLKVMNAPEEVIQDLLDMEKAENFEVWEDNWPCVEMFLRLQTQWRTSFGGLIGIDYIAAKWLFDLYDVKEHREMLDALMIMERSALTALSEKSDGS